MCHGVDFPANALSRKDRAVNADSLVRFITERRSALDRDDAANTDAETAAHRRFERNQTTDVEGASDLGDPAHHHPRAAGIDRRACAAACREVAFKRRGDESPFAEAAIV